MKKIAILSVACVAVAALALAAETALKIKINGKSVDGDAIKLNGELYVPASALKAGGASVSVNGGVVSISFPGAVGGTMQQNGVEGKIGEWLFDGVWRLQVKSIDKQTGDGQGWQVEVEIRNGTKFDGYAPGGTGWQGATIVLEDGTSVSSRSDSPEFRDMGLNQGAGNTQTLYFDTDSTSKPDRFILRFDPKGVEGTPLKFTVPDPSFRVSLKG